MTATRAQIEALARRVDATRPVDRAPLAEELARAADAHGADDLRFASRLRLVQAYTHTSDRSRVLAPFALLLQHYDAAPDWMTRRDRFHVLWHHKWMVSVLVEHPQVPLERLEEALEGMRRRYAEAGQGLAPVLQCGYVLAAHVHGPDRAEDEYDAWVHAPRTYLSDCRACEPSARIRHLAAVGRHDLAVAELGPVLDGTSTCHEQPGWAVSEALVSLLTVGETERAAALHLRTVRTSRRAPAALGHVARHLHVLARTGNLAHGVELLAERLDGLDRPPTPLAGLAFAAAAARLLEALVASGAGDTPVRARGRDPVRADDLLPLVHERVRATSLLFDERNGTSTTGDRFRAWLTAPGLGPMRLGGRGTAVSPGPGGPAQGLDLPRVPSHVDLPAPEYLARLDVIALRGVADLARRFAHRPAWDAIGSHWRGRRDAEVARAATAGADGALVRAVAELDRFTARTARGDEPALRESAARLFRLVRDEGSALLVEQPDRAGGARDVAGFVAAVDARGTPGQRARARWWVVSSGLEGAEADRWRDEALDLLARTGPGSDPEDRLTKARLLLDAGRRDRSAGASSRAEVLALLEPFEHPAIRVGVQVDVASDHAGAGDVPGALAALDAAEATAREAGAPELVLRTLGARGRVLAGAGRHPEAETLLRSVVDGHDAEDDPDGGAQARTRLADLLAQQGRALEASQVVETALGADRTGHAARSDAHARYRAGLRAGLLDRGSRLSADLGDRERAVTLAREAVSVTTGVHGRPAQAALALLHLAGLLVPTDPVEATALHGRALAAAERAGRHDLALVVRRERVRARLAADGPDAALADLDDAVEANRSLEQAALTDRATREALGGWDFAWEAVALATSRANVLQQSGRPAEALVVLAGVPARMRAMGAEAAALGTEVLQAGLLLETGREQDGLQLLDDVAARARETGATGLARAAASAATRWLDGRGRPDEAQQVWDRNLPGGAVDPARDD